MIFHVIFPTTPSTKSAHLTNDSVPIWPNKKMNCFSGTTASVLKVPHFFSYCFLNIVIGNDHLVPLWRRHPLRVMLGCLFIYSRLHFRFDLSSTVFLSVIEPQQCKFYALVMNSNLLNVQSFNYQVSWPDLNDIRWNSHQSTALKKLSEFRKQRVPTSFFCWIKNKNQPCCICFKKRAWETIQFFFCLNRMVIRA